MSHVLSNPFRRIEEELLVCCTHSNLKDATVHRIREICEQPLDWRYIFRTASYHGIVPILYHSLSKVNSPYIPEAVLSQLKAHFYANSLHNDLLAKELIKIISEFETEQIRVIPFKGPILAASVYGDLSLRQFSDLDMIVAEKDLLQCKKILESSGYVLANPQYGRSHKNIIKKYWHYGFIRKKDNLYIELHWRFTPPSFNFPLNFENIWKNKNIFDFNGKKLANLSPEMQLSILSVHGAKHSWRRLNWICDISELLSTYSNIDWIQIIDFAKTTKIRRSVFTGLLLSVDILGVPAPDNITTIVKSNRKTVKLSQKVSDFLFELSDEDYNPYLFYLRLSIFQLKNRERFIDKGKELLRILAYISRPNINDMNLVRLPNRLYFLYIFIKPIRIIFNWAPKRNK